jgi:hypothetical protein
MCNLVAVFSHVQITTTGKHEVFFCDAHKRVHDRRVKGSKEYSGRGMLLPADKTTEDIMADSAILVINRLAELGTDASNKALDAIRKCISDK